MAAYIRRALAKFGAAAVLLGIAIAAPSAVSAQNICAANNGSAAAWSAATSTWTTLPLPGANHQIEESAGNCLAVGKDVVAAWDQTTGLWTTIALTGAYHRQEPFDPNSGGVPFFSYLVGATGSDGNFAATGSAEVAVWNSATGAWTKREGAHGLAASAGNFATYSATEGAIAWNHSTGVWTALPTFVPTIYQPIRVPPQGSAGNFLVWGTSGASAWESGTSTWTTTQLPEPNPQFPAGAYLSAFGGGGNFAIVSPTNTVVAGFHAASTPPKWTTTSGATPDAGGTVASANGSLFLAPASLPSLLFDASNGNWSTVTIGTSSRGLQVTSSNGAFAAVRDAEAAHWDPASSTWTSTTLPAVSSGAGYVAGSGGNFAVPSNAPVVGESAVSVWNGATSSWSTQTFLGHDFSGREVGGIVRGSQGNLALATRVESAAWSKLTGAWSVVSIPGLTVGPFGFHDGPTGSGGNFLAVSADANLPQASAWSAATSLWTPLTVVGDVVLPKIQADGGNFLVADGAGTHAWNGATRLWTGTPLSGETSASSGNFAVATPTQAAAWDQTSSSWQTRSVTDTRAVAGVGGHFAFAGATEAAVWDDSAAQWNAQALSARAEPQIAGASGNLAVAGATEVAAWNQSTGQWSVLALPRASIEPLLVPEPSATAAALAALAILGAAARIERSGRT